MRSDVLVVGSGIAGLTFALAAARQRSVVLITKKTRPESSTNYAQGGIAAVFGDDDSFALHREDTYLAGAGLCHPDAVDALVREGPVRVRELIDRGARFTREAGALSLGREGGHSRRRIVRADDLTGREIERALLAAVADSSNITILEDHAASELIVVGEPRRCVGAWAVPPAGETVPFRAGAVLLATGGCGEVYRHTTNPDIATGDGVAMAFRAGATVANMEFVQFHPTALYPAEDRAFLISEAVRGEGAVLRRIDGTPLPIAHDLGSLAPRDLVARAIDREMKRSGDPFALLDCSPIPPGQLRARFPNILAETARRGIDMLSEPLPVVPAAHYQCGGVFTDTRGRSTLPGLYAAGETACTGVHGANRLASNSLLEAVVYAHRAAEAVLSDGEDPAPEHFPDPPDPGPETDAEQVVDARRRLASLMWESAGIVRTDGWLAAAAAELDGMRSEWRRTGWGGAELRNLLDVAMLIVASARLRPESRGLHFNVDHPGRDNERLLRDTLVAAAPPASGA